MNQQANNTAAADLTDATIERVERTGEELHTVAKEQLQALDADLATAKQMLKDVKAQRRRAVSVLRKSAKKSFTLNLKGALIGAGLGVVGFGLYKGVQWAMSRTVEVAVS